MILLEHKCLLCIPQISNVLLVKQFKDNFSKYMLYIGLTGKSSENTGSYRKTHFPSQNYVSKIQHLVMTRTTAEIE
jgi:hypothetical protein